MERYQQIRGLRQILRTWMCPSFQAHVAWTLYGDGERFLVRRFKPCFDVLQGIEANEDLRLIPETRSPFEEAWAKPEGIKHLIEGLKKSRIDAFPQHGSGGLDGTTYGVRFSASGFTTLELCWWVKPPSGWETVCGIVSDLRSECDAPFPTSTIERYETELAHWKSVFKDKQ